MLKMLKMRSPLPEETETVVINTGPLVSLGRVGAFVIIQQLPLQFLTPLEVAHEMAAGIRKGHPVSMPDWVQVTQLSTPPSLIAQKTLDAGEAAVIQLAIERSIDSVCIDEWRGRRAAKAVGLQVTGSLGLLGRAKHQGLISG